MLTVIILLTSTAASCESGKESNNDTVYIVGNDKEVMVELDTNSLVILITKMSISAIDPRGYIVNKEGEDFFVGVSVARKIFNSYECNDIIGFIVNKSNENYLLTYIY